MAAADHRDPLTVYDAEVLVVGAGPTGLMLANWLTREGVRAVVVDGKDGPTRESRAVVLQARSLEIYDQLGMAREVIDRSEAVRSVAPGYHRRRFGFLPVGDLGAGITPFPRLYMLEQSRNEEALHENLLRLGGEVRWGRRLVSLHSDDDGVRAHVDGPDGSTTIRVRYCVGADGSNSLVRRSRDIAFDGLTNPQSFFVCDATEVRGFSHESVNVRLGDTDFLLGFPMSGSGHHRLIGSVVDDGIAGGIDEPRLRRRLDRVYGVTWGESAWFSVYRVHHRVAARFRDGAVFLAGDAAHVHSPVGGQGMNTGLQDAHNLALKLVDVLRREADDRSLDRYEAERRPVALRLVATTDRVFRAVISPSRINRLIRRRVVPLVGPLLLSIVARAGIVPRLFGYLSQTRIHYWMSDRDRAQSSGRREPVIGRRLRWTGANFAALESASWQVHSYGRMDPAEIASLRGALAIPVHTFPVSKRTGLRPRMFYLVRPDAFVADAAHPDDAIARFAPLIPRDASRR